MRGLTLRIQKLDTPDRVAYHRILTSYGAGCFPQGTEETETHWKVLVGVHFPSKVTDDRTNRERILTFHFNNLGEILIKKSTLRIEKSPSPQAIERSILDKRAEIRTAVEKDLIKVFGEPDAKIKFGALKFGQAGLQPIYRIVNRILMEDYPTYMELEEIGKHYLDQVDLIINLGYVKYSDDASRRLIPENKLMELFGQIKDVEETSHAMLGLVVANCYYDLRKSMRIAQFIPYVRASATYYGEAVEFGELFSISKRRLRDDVKKYYRGAPMQPRVRFGFPTILRELSDANILRYDQNYVTGRDEIFQRLITMRDSFPMTEAPYA